MYHTACFLVEGFANLEQQKQSQFNTTLFQYLLLFSVVGIIIGSMIHFYLIKKLIHPIRKLIKSTKQLQKGHYPDQITTTSKDEMGELTEQYNLLIQQLKTNESHRQKLVSDLSHELRTPLANLNGYLQALKSGVIEGNTDLYQSLHAESERMTHMLEQLDKLKEWDHVSTQAITQKEAVDIKEQIRQCTVMFEWALSEAHIELHMNIEREYVNMNISGIQQVLSNLIDNAIQYYDGSDPIVVKGEKIASKYRISVTGPSTPILESEAEHVFERFYRQDKSRNRQTGGSGLGLAISKQIIANHDGDIGYEKIGDLNMFWFTIPLK